VLQLSLDQSISREALEQAVTATESLAKPDCAILSREQFGIVAGNLSQTEALGMQAVLRAHGVDTEVVDESALPKLPPPKRAQSFTLATDGLHVVEFTVAQEIVLPFEVFVFAAAGAVEHLAMRPREELE